MFQVLGSGVHTWNLELAYLGVPPGAPDNYS